MIFTFVLWSIAVLSVDAIRVWPEPNLIEKGHNIQWVSRTFGLEVVLHCEEDGIQRHAVINSNTVQGLFQNSLSGWLSYVPGFQDGRQDLSEDRILREAVGRSVQTIKTTTFVPWKTHPRRSLFEPDPASDRDGGSELSRMHIKQLHCPSQSKLHPRKFFESDESYELSIDEGIANIDSKSTLGTIRALQTFEQLFYAHSNYSNVYVPHTPLRISDEPRWLHRGLHLDIARNVFALEDVLRTIDAMASVKMSRLHLHATDSQSWPIDIPSLPQLASKGAYHQDQILSEADLHQMQKYGVSRGVSVFLEIDLPGHTAAIAHAYPELITAFDEPDWSTFAAEPLSGQLKLNSTSVYRFLGTLLDDLLPRVKEFTSIHHAGGDEFNMNAYLLDENVRSNDPEIIRPLLQEFMDVVLTHANQHNLQPILWEEMLLDYNLTIPSAQNTASHSDVIIQVWRSSQNLVRVIDKGHRVLFGDYEYWYLDCGYGGFLNPYPDGVSPPGVPYNSSGGVSSRLRAPYLDYCSPLNNWRHMYSYNPLVNISKDLHYLIEGGEVLMWSEQTDPIDLDSKLWPRAAAAAEVLWSGPRKPEMIDDAEKRLAEWRERMVLDHGIRSSPVGMTWCLMEGGCHL